MISPKPLGSVWHPRSQNLTRHGATPLPTYDVQKAAIDLSRSMEQTARGSEKDVDDTESASKTVDIPSSASQ